MDSYNLLYSNIVQTKSGNTDAVNGSHLHCECFISGVANQEVKGFVPSRGRGALTNLGTERTGETQQFSFVAFTSSSKKS